MRRVERRHHERVLRRDPRLRRASRTIELMCPSSAMCSGSRSSVQNAIRSGPNSRDERQQRVRGCAPPRPRGSAATSRRAAARGPPRPCTPRGRSGSRPPRRRSAACRARPARGRRRATRRRARASRARARRPRSTPGKFIISASPITRRRRSSPSRSPGVSARRGDSNCDAGTHDDAMNVDVERHLAAGVEQPVDAVGAEHVRDLVRVGDDRGRPERQHEPRELVDEQLRRLEVHVRVDEARARRSGRTRRASPRPRSRRARRRSRPTIATSVSSHSRVKTESTRAAADDEVGRLVAAGDGEAARKVGPSAPNRTALGAVDVLTSAHRSTRRCG